MSDNTPIVDGNSVAEVIASDELSTVNGIDVSGASPRIKAQRVKVGHGVDGAFTDVSAADPLPVSVDAALPAGGNTIGGVNVISLPALPAGGNTIGTVNVGTMPAAAVATDAIGAAPLAETTLAGATPFKLISAASTNATSVKASVGKVFYIAAFNLNASPRYLKLYDKASAPIVGTDTPKHVFLIPGNAAGAGLAISLGMPAKFANGIALALTTGIADSDTGAVAANEIVVNLGYV